MRTGALSIFASLLMTTQSLAETRMWVASEEANRRTCPSLECGVVGTLLFRELATVLETKDGWARVTRYYDAACVDGRSKYVEKGDAECVPENGIVGGQLAEWVELDLLSTQRAPDPSKGATGTAQLVAGSDDFLRYRAEFVKAAEALIATGQCTPRDLSDAGGFLRSTNKGRGIYFTYCRNGSDRIYLDVTTGRTFR
jgi:hypothetical protein